MQQSHELAEETEAQRGIHRLCKPHSQEVRHNLRGHPTGPAHARPHCERKGFSHCRPAHPSAPRELCEDRGQSGSLPAAALLPARPRPLPTPPRRPTTPLPRPHVGPISSQGPQWSSCQPPLPPPSRHLQLPDKIPTSQFRARHPLPDTPMNMEHKSLPWEARPRAHPARPGPPGPTAYCEHFPCAKQCAEPFVRTIPLLRTCNNARKKWMLSFPICRFATRNTLGRSGTKTLCNFRKAAAPLFRCCKIPAGLISLLSAHLASQHPDEPTKARCGVGTTFTPHQHPLPRWPQKAWCRPSGVSLLPPGVRREDHANRARELFQTAANSHVLSKQCSVSVWAPPQKPKLAKCLNLPRLAILGFGISNP